MKFRYSAGEFKYPIKFKKRKKATSSLEDDTYILFFECKAKVKKAKAAEQKSENRITAQKELNLIIRFPKGIEITEYDIFEFKNRHFNITFLDNIEELDVYLELIGVEV